MGAVDIKALVNKNGFMEENTCYRIYDTVEEQEICRAETLNTLFKRFCRVLHRQNNATSDFTTGFKGSVDFRDMKISFDRRDLVVQKGEIEKQMVFTTDE